VPASRQRRTFHVYILTNLRHTVLYTGVTGWLRLRLTQHRRFAGSRFAAAYRANRLVYLETYPTMLEAIAREKQLKGGSRADKLRLIESANPEWRDLSEEL
jgi:putative endonuclease